MPDSSSFLIRRLLVLAVVELPIAGLLGWFLCSLYCGLQRDRFEHDVRTNLDLAQSRAAAAEAMLQWILEHPELANETGSSSFCCKVKGMNPAACSERNMWEWSRPNAGCQNLYTVDIVVDPETSERTVVFPTFMFYSGRMGSGA